jgi:hypothetical protein
LFVRLFVCLFGDGIDVGCAFSHITYLPLLYVNRPLMHGRKVVPLEEPKGLKIFMTV